MDSVCFDTTGFNNSKHLQTKFSDTDLQKENDNTTNSLKE